jgi:hypothetical protein
MRDSQPPGRFRLPLRVQPLDGACASQDRRIVEIPRSRRRGTRRLLGPGTSQLVQTDYLALVELSAQFIERRQGAVCPAVAPERPAVRRWVLSAGRCSDDGLARHAAGQGQRVVPGPTPREPPSVSMRAVKMWPLYGVSMSSGGRIRPDAMRSRSVTLRQGVFSQARRDGFWSATGSGGLLASACGASVGSRMG